MKIKKCKKCGCKNFWVNESQTWDCCVDDKARLRCFNPNAIIDTIICQECDTIHDEKDFEEINFE
jgi:hypothetical protein